MNVYCLWNKGFNHNKQKLGELNVWTSNKKQQNKNKCVLWSKGLYNRQKLCELIQWMIRM